MLTKWTFAFFIFLPALVRKEESEERSDCRHHRRAIAAYWYDSAARATVTACCRSTRRNLSVKAIPARFSLDAVIFYIRALEGYQLFLPLFLAFVAGLVLLLAQVPSEMDADRAVDRRRLAGTDALSEQGSALYRAAASRRSR